MRKAVGLLFAVSLLVSVTVAASGPAGAANTTLPKCKALTGTQTFKPGLPIFGNKKLVKPLTTTNIKITGCSGGGITGGKSSGAAVAKKATNCNALLTDAGKPAAPVISKITWSNGQVSNTSSVLTTTKPSLTTIGAKLVTTYTGGLGKGHKSTATILATPNKNFCVKVPFTMTNFKSTKIVSS